ncbi:MAG: plasmid pRiA4b ORF-3 family protein [Vicingaceae bacterium]|nr:plasmid pRiA4b ORF-3 family protein [Vicingaceae bacterium]
MKLNTYDFGDSWKHLIKVENFLQKEKNVKYPICIDGELNCPPEDCGGVWGFYELLETIKNKKHPEHEEMLEWLGGQYDEEYFDKELVNKRLLKLK